MKRIMTCIVCPLGCELEVLKKENGEIIITGNTCRRGEEYGKSECTNPVRTVTTTMRCESGAMVSVKTDRAVAKDRVFEVMKSVKGIICPLPIHVGDVIIKNVCGADIIATMNIE